MAFAALSSPGGADGQACTEGASQILEHQVGDLQTLPARVEALELQILLLRQEMGAEFSAVRAELSAVRDEMRSGDAETRRFMRVLHEELVSRLRALGEGNASAGYRPAAGPLVGRYRRGQT